MGPSIGEDLDHRFNYAIFLYDMNADDVFVKTRHLLVDSSLGVVEETDDILPAVLSDWPGLQ